uniref:Putative secreted protein n=1 Tax=Anopheles darlingi TaxID=43151 RepID=A0A2M4DDL3_ANODA
MYLNSGMQPNRLRWNIVFLFLYHFFVNARRTFVYIHVNSSIWFKASCYWHYSLFGTPPGKAPAGKGPK